VIHAWKEGRRKVDAAFEDLPEPGRNACCDTSEKKGEADIRPNLVSEGGRRGGKLLICYQEGKKLICSRGESLAGRGVELLAARKKGKKRMA